MVDARITGHKPKKLDTAATAAILLTALTAWEGLFEHLSIQNADVGERLLIIGGAGGAGSLSIPQAKYRSKVKVIATASRPDSTQWCLDRGADITINYHNMAEELNKHG